MTEPKEKNAEESDDGSDGAQGSSHRKPKTTIGESPRQDVNPKSCADPGSACDRCRLKKRKVSHLC